MNLLFYMQVSTLIEQVVEDESQMEGLMDNCSRVMVWHIDLESSYSFYPQKWIVKNNLDAIVHLPLVWSPQMKKWRAVNCHPNCKWNLYSLILLYSILIFFKINYCPAVYISSFTLWMFGTMLKFQWLEDLLSNITSYPEGRTKSLKVLNQASQTTWCGT